MTLLRRVARPMLASVFVIRGIEALRRAPAETPDPESTPVGPESGARWPEVPEPSDADLFSAAVMVGAGAMFATGRLPRVAALALAGALTQSTLSLHRFWEVSDRDRRREEQSAFATDLALLGALLLAAADTQGRPGLAWRARHAGHHAGHHARERLHGTRPA